MKVNHNLYIIHLLLILAWCLVNSEMASRLFLGFWCTQLLIFLCLVRWLIKCLEAQTCWYYLVIGGWIPVLSSVVIMSKSFYLLCCAYHQPPADDGIKCVYLLIQEWFLICCKVGRWSGSLLSIQEIKERASENKGY